VESGLIPIKDVVFEHRLYLPSVGFFLAATMAVGLLGRWLSSRVLVAMMVSLIALFSVGTFKRNMVWQSTITLWEDVIAKSPNKLRPYYNVGCEYANRNDMQAAISYFQKSINIKEDQPECHNNLGSALLRVERVDEAMYHLKRAIELNQSYAMAYYNLGLVYAYKGEADAALESVQKAIELDPANNDFRSKLELLRQYLK
jgi:tetratricopeptide (TPR) repeat protein